MAGTFVETEHLASAEALTAWAQQQYDGANMADYVAAGAGEHRDNHATMSAATRLWMRARGPSIRVRAVRKEATPP